MSARGTGGLRRAATLLTTPLPLLVVLLVAALLVPVGTQGYGGAQRGEVPGAAAVPEIDAADLVPVSNRCRGANAFRNKGCTAQTKTGGYSPTGIDRTSVYRRDCIAKQPHFAMKRCHIGVPRGQSLKVALVGNSLASQWADSIGLIAQRRNWMVMTYLASSCSPNETRWPSGGAVAETCHDWGQTVRRSIINQGIDVVVFSAAPYQWLSQSDPAAGYQDWMQPLIDAGVRIVAIKANPRQDSPNTGRCLRDNPRNYHACGTKPAKAVFADPALTAVSRLRTPRAASFGMTDLLCTPQLCPAVIGGVMAYYDRIHLTAAYARTTAPYLMSKLVTVVGRVQRAA